MITWRAFVNLILGVALFALAGCYDGADGQLNTVIALYHDKCRESSTVQFFALTADSTCNGQPLLIAMAQFTEIRDQVTIASFLDYLVSEKHFNLNVHAANGGLTPAMIAVDRGNAEVAREVILRSEPSVVDDAGSNVFYHLAAADFADYAGLILPSPALPVLLQQKNKQQVSAFDLAVRRHNLPFIWTVMRLTGRVDFLNGLDASFLFSDQVSTQTAALDALGSRIAATYEGDVLGRRVSGYSLLHFACERHLPDLVQYLISRGADLAASSSDGSPLALAVRGAGSYSRSGEYGRWERTVELLLAQPKALLAHDALNALLSSGRVDWIQLALHSALPIYSYAGLVLQNSSTNSAWQSQALSCQAPAHCDVAALRTGISSGLVAPANAAGQNAAHFFFALLDENLIRAAAGGVVFDGFSWFTRSAASRGLLDQADILGMLPIHFWLANPERAARVKNPTELAEFRLLLRETHDSTAFNVNHDSVLSLAVMTGNRALVEEILRARPETRALIRVPNLLGRSPLSMAEANGRKDIYETLSTYL